MLSEKKSDSFQVWNSVYVIRVVLVHQTAINPVKFALRLARQLPCNANDMQHHNGLSQKVVFLSDDFIVFCFCFEYDVYYRFPDVIISNCKKEITGLLCKWIHSNAVLCNISFNFKRILHGGQLLDV